MRMNIDMDDALIAEAMEELGVKTKDEAVAIALQRAVRSGKQLRAVDELKGIGWDGDLEGMRTSKYIPAE
jgi:Arc/MetJ family transcription regulator